MEARPPAGREQDVSALLAEQVAYYRARAPEYEQGALPSAWGGEPEAALEAFAPTGDVLSHVPLERFEEFWSRVDGWLKPGGRVFFVDDAYRTDDELIYGEDSSIVQRRLSDGSAHRIVKVPHRPQELEQRLRALGWGITVSSSTRGPFYWGAGGRA